MLLLEWHPLPAQSNVDFLVAWMMSKHPRLGVAAWPYQLEPAILRHIFELADDDRAALQKLESVIVKLGREISTASVVSSRADQLLWSDVWDHMALVELKGKSQSGMQHCCVCRMCFKPLRFISAAESIPALKQHFEGASDFAHQQAFLGISIKDGWLVDDMLERLQGNGCDVKMFEESMLLQAGRCGNTEVVEWALVESGCNALARNKCGNTFLHLACNYGHVNILAWLHRAAAEDDIRLRVVRDHILTCENNTGETALEIVVRQPDSYQIARMLLHDADDNSIVQLYELHWGPGMFERKLRLMLASARDDQTKAMLSAAVCHEAVQSVIRRMPSCNSLGDLQHLKAIAQAWNWWPFQSASHLSKDELLSLYFLLRNACAKGNIDLVDWLLDEWHVPFAAPEEFHDTGMGYRQQGVTAADCAALGDAIKTLDTESLQGRAPAEPVPQYWSTWDLWEESRWDGRADHAAVMETFITERAAKMSHGTHLDQSSDWLDVKIFKRRLRSVHDEPESRRRRLRVLARLLDRFGQIALPRIDLLAACGRAEVLQWLVTKGHLSLEELVPLQTQLDAPVASRQGMRVLATTTSLMRWMTQTAPWLLEALTGTPMCVGELLLAVAAAHGGLPVVVWLAPQYAAAARYGGRNVLHIACRSGQYAVLKWLVENGYSWLATDLSPEGLSAVHEAVIAGHYKILMYASIKELLGVDREGRDWTWYAEQSGHDVLLCEVRRARLRRAVSYELPEMVRDGASVEAFERVLVSTGLLVGIMPGEEELRASLVQFICSLCSYGRVDVLQILYASEGGLMEWLAWNDLYDDQLCFTPHLGRAAAEGTVGAGEVCGLLKGVEVADMAKGVCSKCLVEFNSLFEAGCDVARLQELAAAQKAVMVAVDERLRHGLTCYDLQHVVAPSHDLVSTHSLAGGAVAPMPNILGITHLDFAARVGYTHLVDWLLPLHGGGARGGGAVELALLRRTMQHPLSEGGITTTAARRLEMVQTLLRRAVSLGADVNACIPPAVCQDEDGDYRGRLPEDGDPVLFYTYPFLASSDEDLKLGYLMLRCVLQQPEVHVDAPGLDGQTLLQRLADGQRYYHPSTLDSPARLWIGRAMRALIAHGASLTPNIMIHDGAGAAGVGGVGHVVQNLVDAGQLEVVGWLAEEKGVHVESIVPAWLSGSRLLTSLRGPPLIEQWEHICTKQRARYARTDAALRGLAEAVLAASGPSVGDDGVGGGSSDEEWADRAAAIAGVGLWSLSRRHGVSLGEAARAWHPAAEEWVMRWERGMLAAWMSAAHARLGEASPAGRLEDQLLRHIADLVLLTPT